MILQAERQIYSITVTHVVIVGLAFLAVFAFGNEMTLLDPLHERVYAVLKSFPSGATEPEFISEFKFYIQYDVPFESYGFASLKDFIASAPNLYEIKW
ncbi:hypothetical protein T08_8031 [Trichinella sp. T8]|nr:hypothetical protein T08_8031 [Trichinella sp. T8]